MFDAQDLPILRDVSNPFDARVFEFGVGVEAAGDGAVDEDGFLLIKEFAQEWGVLWLRIRRSEGRGGS